MLYATATERDEGKNTGAQDKLDNGVKNEEEFHAAILTQHC